MKTLYVLLTALPDIIRLLQALQKNIDSANLERKVSDDLKTIHGAFIEKDATKLTALFNS